MRILFIALCVLAVEVPPIALAHVAGRVLSGVGFDELVQELIDVSMEQRRKPVSNRITRILAA